MLTALLVLGDKFPNRWDEVLGNFHDRLRSFLKRGLVLRYRLFLRLLLVIGEDAANSLFVPPWTDAVREASRATTGIATAVVLGTLVWGGVVVGLLWLRWF